MFEPPNTPRRLLVEFLGVSRVLLAESPSRAERLTSDVPELRQIMERGFGVVRWYDPQEPSYISVRDGLRTTSDTIPPWADPSDVIQMAEPATPGKDLLERLQRLGKAVHERDPDRYAAYRLADTIAAVEARYDDDLLADTVGCMEAAAEHETLDAGADVSLDLDAFRQLTLHARQEYHHLRMSGNGVRNLLALLAVLEVAGPLAEAAVVLAKGELRRLLEEGGRPLGNLDSKVVLPVLDLSFWIHSFNMATEGRAWVPAISGGRVCLSSADQYRDSARLALTFEEFHRSLYLALVYYRAAAVLFDTVAQDGPTRVRAPLLEEALDRSRTCEEMRARIETSIGWAVDQNPMGYNLTLPERLEPWVRWLLKASPDTAMAEIYNLGSQLAFPDFVRDVALSVMDLIEGRHERAVGRAARVIEQMESHMLAITEWGMGYFTYTAALAATGLRSLGRDAEAAMFDQRLKPDWIQERLSHELETNDKPS